MADSDYNPDIETGADTLLDFLEEKSRYPVSDIAEDLGVPEEKVEKWAEALEKGDLITIDYSAIKGMVLEYDSDKSIDELNEGRHELSMKTDSVQVNVEEIEEMEDKSDSGASAGFVQEAEEKDEEEAKEADSKESGEVEEEEKAKDTGSSAESSNDDPDSELPESETSERDEENERDGSVASENSTRSSGSDTDSSREPGSGSLSVSKKDSGGKDSPSVTMRAKKAMLNKIDKDSVEENEESSESKSEPGDEVSEELNSNLSQIEKKGSGKYQSEEDIDWNPGEDIKEVDQNIRELSDLISDSEYDSEEVYDRIAYQTKVLKEKLKEKPLSERDDENELRQDIVDTIDTLNTKINKKNSLKSKISQKLDKLKSILAEIVHKIGIEKVDE